MRRLILAALLAVAPMLTLDSTPASACWYGYNTYSYWPRHAYARAPVWVRRGWHW
jgi:hypothetical protein